MFRWVLRTFIKKTKRELSLQDLYKPLQSHESEILGDQLERYWTKELSNSLANNGTPSLFWAITKMAFCDFATSGLPLLMYTILR